MVLQKSRKHFFLIGLFFSMVTQNGVAQNYPSKPIRMLLPFPAGGPSDIVGRTIGQKMAEQMGVTLVPDNRGGAGGNLGMAVAAKMEADGYNVVLATPGVALSPSLYKKLDYDAQKDFASVARLAAIENVLVVHPSVPAKTLREFVTLARNRPGALNYGSGGAGTTNHLANELLKSLENIKMVHVPYKGATLAAVALIGGEVDEVVVSVPSSLPFIRSGRLRALAVLSEKRVSPLPDLPTSTEAGIPGLKMSIWYGMLAPAATPPAVIKRLSQETIKALNSPDLRARLTKQGIEPWPGTPAEMDTLIRTEKVRFAGIVQKAGLEKR